MAQELGVGYVTIMPSTQGLQKNIQDSLGGAFNGALSKGQGKFRSFFSTVAAAGASILAAVGIGKLVKSTISAGVQFNALEQSSNAAFKTILGSAGAANALMAQLDTFATASPFSKSTFIQGTQQLLGFGVAADRVIPTLQAVQDAVAAVGGTSDDISQITYALAQIKGEGKLTGQTLNQLGQYGINAADIIAKQMGTTSQTIRDMATSPGGIPADKVFDVLVNGLESNFAGAAANVKQTWTGVTQSISARFRNIGSDLVEPFISKAGGGYAITWLGLFANGLSAVRASPAFAQITKSLGDFGAALDPIVTTMFTKFNSFLQTADFSGFTSNLTAILPVLLPVLGGLVAVFSQLAGDLPFIGKFLPVISGPLGVILGIVAALLATSPALRSSLGGAFQTIVAAVQSVFTQLQPVFAQLMPVVAVLASQLGSVLAGAVTILVPIVVELVHLLGDLLAQALPILIPIIQQVGGAILALGDSLLPVASAVLQALMPAIQSLIPVVLAVISAVLPLVSTLLRGLMPVILSLLPVISGLAQQLGAGLATILPLLIPIIMQVAGVLGSLLQAILPIIASVISQLLPVFVALVPVILGIVAAVLPLVSVLLSALMPVFNALMPVVTTVLGLLLPLLDVFTQLLAPILSLLAPLIELVTTILTPLLAIIGPLITMALKPLMSVFKLLLPPIMDIVSGLGDSLIPIIGAVTKILGGLITFLTGVFTGNWKQAWKGIVQIFTGIWDGITAVIKGVLNTAINLINGMIGGINDITAGIKAATGGAINLHIGKIPHLADSGTVKPRPGGTLALIAERGRAESVVDTGDLNGLIDAARRSLGSVAGPNAGGLDNAEPIDISSASIAALAAALGAVLAQLNRIQARMGVA